MAFMVDMPKAPKASLWHKYHYMIYLSDLTLCDY